MVYLYQMLSYLVWFILRTFTLCFKFLNIQGEHKRTLHFQNDTENKRGILRTLHLHQSI
jgi:hypothetical protein